MPPPADPEISNSVAAAQTETNEINTQENQTPPESASSDSGNPTAEASDHPSDGDGDGDGDGGGEEREEGECGFCVYMKAGGCRDSFIAWEMCMEESEKNKEDAVEKCFDVTVLLKKCMDEHADYYMPILQAEQEAAKELERENASSTESDKLDALSVDNEGEAAEKKTKD